MGAPIKHKSVQSHKGWVHNATRKNTSTQHGINHDPCEVGLKSHVRRRCPETAPLVRVTCRHAVGAYAPTSWPEEVDYMANLYESLIASMSPAEKQAALIAIASATSGLPRVKRATAHRADSKAGKLASISDDKILSIVRPIAEQYIENRLKLPVAVSRAFYLCSLHFARKGKSVRHYTVEDGNTLVTRYTWLVEPIATDAELVRAWRASMEGKGQAANTFYNYAVQSGFFSPSGLEKPILLKRA